jgi:hypothetical protein
VIFRNKRAAFDSGLLSGDEVLYVNKYICHDTCEGKIAKKFRGERIEYGGGT